jgi:hypothetical protein
VHLSSTKYGPKLLAKGARQSDVMRNEQAIRMPGLQPVLDEASSLMDQDIPVFVLGDFNAPSHRDWTTAAAGLRSHVTGRFRWPMSIAAEGIGLVDSYRAVYPDPVQNPGLTWPAARPFVAGYNPGMNGAAADRIDLLYAGGAATPVEALIVGEDGSEFTDVAVSPWPTDHRAVVVRFDVDPAPPPTLVTIDQRLVEIGQKRSVRYFSDSAAAASLSVVPSGGSTDDATVEQRLADPSSGSWPLPTEVLAPGAFDVVLLDSGGAELQRVGFWLVEPGTTPTLTTDKKAYAPGEPIDVSWQSAPGNKWDWIGIYRRDADPDVAYYKTWAYTKATVAGSETLDGSDSGGPWPMTPGEYSVYLLVDDSYREVAGADFIVRG